jgi:hypothetical protein
MKYYVTENRNLKVWTEKPDERDYITDTINEKVLSWRGAIDYAKAAEKWKKAFDKQDEILTSPELKEQLTPGQVIDGDSFKWNRAKTFDPGKYIKDKGFEVGCAECCNGDCDCEVGERCKFKGNRKGCTYCKGECFYRTENDVPKVAVPLDTAHKCQYCGAMTTQPDEQCWNNPKNHKYTEGEDDISGEFHEAQQRRPDTATEESNLREAEVEAVKRYPDFKYEGIMGPVSAQRAQQQIELRRKDFIAGWEAARKALAPDKFTRQDMEGLLEWFGRKYNDEFQLIGKGTYGCNTGYSITTSQLIDEYIKQKVLK